MLKTFKKEFKKRFPDENTKIVEGRPQSTDNKGTPYLTICIGGEKHKGSSYKLISNLSKSDLCLWDMWWDSLHRYVKGCKRIEVRRFPKVVEWKKSVLDIFDTEHPKLLTENCSQISGRFSFYR